MMADLSNTFLIHFSPAAFQHMVFNTGDSAFKKAKAGTDGTVSWPALEFVAYGFEVLALRAVLGMRAEVKRRRGKGGVRVLESSVVAPRR